MSSVVLTFAQRFYDAEVIQKAAYRGQSAFTLDMKIQGDDLVCTLLCNITTSSETFTKAVEDFKKDVLDYQLRSKLQAQTTAVRNLILGVAFSQSGLN
jgi:His-Xaa-Ser system protein HxsD